MRLLRPFLAQEHKPESHARTLALFAFRAVKAASGVAVHSGRPELGTISIRVGLHAGEDARRGGGRRYGRMVRAAEQHWGTGDVRTVEEPSPSCVPLAVLPRPTPQGPFCV